MTEAARKPQADGTPPIPFIDLQAQRRRLGARIDAAMARVLAHGAFILGPEVAEFERSLASFAGVQHAVGLANGTDALVLPLIARGIGAGDAVFIPAFTFAATAEAVVLAGATPWFVDVEADSCNLDPRSLAEAIEACVKEGRLRPRAVIPVDLYGQPARYGAIAAIAARHGLWMLADAAQSFGASLDNRRVGGFGDATAVSFFPSKPLGCYGDGGAVVTDDGDLAAVLRSLRMHGQGEDRYDHVRVGTNSRLDTLQAAILIEKLAILDDETERRQAIAARYATGLAGICETPGIARGARSVWAQYTIRLDRRDAVAAALKAEGIPTAIHYPRALPDQPAYREHRLAPGGVAVSRRLAARVLSLPMHPYLEPAVQDRIIAALRRAIGGGA